MLKTAGLILLLLWCGQVGTAANSEAVVNVHTNSTGKEGCSQQPDISTELRDMSRLILEQREELRHTKTQLEALENRLSASESLIDQLKAENQASQREKEQSRVSFSASLLTGGTQSIGPAGDLPLVFKNIITNIGGAYSAYTGVFRAPIRGAYWFSLTVYGLGHQTIHTAASLLKNGGHVVIVYCHQPVYSGSCSNGASLLLEVGDEVFVRLHPGAWVRDIPQHPTTFSGHLLFPM
ncbi:complement C1q tumor necrosis factor-related protein 4-like isoform X2 [Engraulis encrasicolus]|uniref:complement C1q tumor necrosis factor-related protein 4-like isoform X2 n=1 Tax=Engraulis encrasicolus TaxID=184585 RepID=UPI002FD2F8FD